MPRGDKSSYSDTQKREAEHIEAAYEDKGVGTKEAESRAWATVNKQDGGGKKSGSGRKKSAKKAAKKSGKKVSKKAAKKTAKKSAKQAPAKKTMKKSSKKSGKRSAKKSRKK